MDSCRILIESARLTGGSVDLGGGNACAQIVQAELVPLATYGPSAGRAAVQTRGSDPQLDGADIPSSIDFSAPDGPGSELSKLTDSASPNQTGTSGTSAMDDLISAATPANSGGTAALNPDAQSSNASSMSDLTKAATTAAPQAPTASAPDQGAGAPTLSQSPTPLLDTPDADQSSGGADPKVQNPLLRLIDWGASKIGTAKEKLPDFAYDQVGDAISGKIYEDPSEKGLAKLLEDALTSPPPDNEPGVLKQLGAGFFAGAFFDKMTELRHRITTNQQEVDNTPYGKELRDMLWSMDPANLRKGIYGYSQDMLEKLNKLLDAALSGAGN